MANRFKPASKSVNGLEPLSTGYSTVTPDFHIPSSGIEDVDIAMFELFDKELPLQVGSTNGTNIKKVPVVFAGGEKWAQLKKNKPLRDKSNSLILPIITIGRTAINQNLSEDIVGRGMNQRTGEIMVRRRLSKTDRGYQKLINRTGIQNQNNVFLNNRTDPGPFRLSPIGDMLLDPVVAEGGFLLSDKTKNIIETISVPVPQFVTLIYEVIIWTQYTHHMNQIIETLMSSYLPQVQGWRLDTPKGYWFVAEVEDGSMSPETNFDDMTQGERLIKTRFNVRVPAYIFASSAPGVPVPVKRYLSMPQISFEAGTSDRQSEEEDPVSNVQIATEPFLGVDDPTLPLQTKRPLRRDGRRDGSTRLNFDPSTPSSTDPALLKKPRGRAPDQYIKLATLDGAGNKKVRHVKIANINKFTGETTYMSGLDLSELSGVEADE
jgi:hypothetical protein